MADIIDVADALVELGISSDPTNEERAIVASAIRKATGAIKRYLGYDPTHGTRTEYLPAVHRTAPRDLVQDIAGNRAVEVDYTDYGTGLQLTHLPVRSITSLYIDYNAKAGAAVGGAFAADTIMEAGTDYWLDAAAFDSSGASMSKTGLVWSTGAWPATPGTIKVVYVAGYTTAELRGQDSVIDASPLWDACLDEAVRHVIKSFTVRKQSRGWTAGTITSERLGDYAVSYGGTSGAGSAGDRRTGGVYDLLPETTQKLSEYVNWGLRLSGGM